MRRLIPALGLVAVAAGCGMGSSHHAGTTATTPTRSSTTPATTTPAPAGKPVLSRFRYDRLAPLNLTDRGIVNKRYPVKIHDVSYQSPMGGEVPAFLIVPPGKARKPAVIYMHGSGGNRLEDLAQATWMAARGAVTMTITSPFERPDAPTALSGIAGIQQQRDLTIQAIVDLRRAVDVLQSRPDVDRNRIGFVGWSSGARMGALLASAEHRIRAYVLQSGGSPPVADYVKAAPASLRPELTQLLGAVDPLAAIPHAHPSLLLFQDGRKDTIVPHAALVGLAAAASKPKQIRWYDAGHAPTKQEIRDEMAWLAQKLQIHGPPVKGAQTGP
jgi:dienelactone hydrolase